MRIYLAGMFAGRQATESSTSANLMVTRDTGYPWVLESYHYIGKGNRMTEIIRGAGIDIFLDSGAFSMFTQGAEIDLEEYAAWIKDRLDMIHIASNVDVIGEGNEQGSYDNLKRLEDLGVKVQPVHHVRDRDEWLVKYLEEGYDYIFLGGMVPESTPTLKKWLDHVWDKYLTDAQGRPLVKVHGFGLTTTELMFRYPWFSVDSTSWVMCSSFGGCYLDLVQPDGSIRDFKIFFSSQSTKLRQDTSWHYANLKPAEKEMVDRRLAELDAQRLPLPDDVRQHLEETTGLKQGFYPETLAEMYGWRDWVNIEYFRHAQKRGVDVFKCEQGGLFT